MERRRAGERLVEVELALASTWRTRLPVGVYAAGGDADQDVAGAHLLGSPQLVALGEADRETGQVEVVGGERSDRDARRSRRRAGRSRPPDSPCRRRRRGRHALGHNLGHHQVVEEEERVGAAGGDVVDVHRHGVDADRVVDAHLAGDHGLRAGAVGAGHQHGVVDRRHTHDAAEAADAREDERVPGRLQPLLEQPDGLVAGFDVDAGVLVAEAVALGHGRVVPDRCRRAACGVHSTAREAAGRGGRRAGLRTGRLDRTARGAFAAAVAV